MTEQQTKTTTPAVLAEEAAWVVLQRQCKAFVASGYLPAHITKNATPEVAIARALTIATKGRELGIPPLQAFSSIYLVEGKPALAAELMLALIYAKCRGAQVTYLTPPEKANEEATFEFVRPGGKPQVFRFTMEDAKRAGVAGKDNWRKYPAAMLRARCVSAGARAVFPDAIMGCYTPEELGGPAIIEGEIIEDETPRDAEYGSVPPSTAAETPPDCSKPLATLDPSTGVVTAHQPVTVRVEGPTSAEMFGRRMTAEGTVLEPPVNGVQMPVRVSDAQMRMIHAVGKEKGYDHGQLREMAHGLYHVASLGELDSTQASRFITELKAISPMPQFAPREPGDDGDCF